ncbi:TorF family putative porin [uncultured Ferrimonas sp.]|uniref:TorF family putative porin n=1 Tax=uncultured Ferrimonas sp. TaxID=432640 RepID=UPI00260938C9|nr:TorF family putative porin [uncultured Ferrimonas sp.]
MRTMRLMPLCALLLALPSHAASVDVSGNLLLVNNYLWRGMTLSLEDPSLQGSVTLEHETGLFAGIAAESYRYHDDDGKRQDDYELDYYAGYYRDLTDRLALQLDVNVFTYGDFNHNTEWGLTAFYGDSQAAIYYDQDVESWYGQLGHDLVLTDALSLALHGGYYFDDADYYGWDDSSYFDVAATLNWAVSGNVNLMAGATYHEHEKGYGLVGIEVTF